MKLYTTGKSNIKIIQNFPKKLIQSEQLEYDKLGKTIFALIRYSSIATLAMWLRIQKKLKQVTSSSYNSKSWIQLIISKFKQTFFCSITSCLLVINSLQKDNCRNTSKKVESVFFIKLRTCWNICRWSFLEIGDTAILKIPYYFLLVCRTVNTFRKMGI